jgi:predicted kinase
VTKLLVLVGLPRSGKTTYCNNVLKPQGFVIVNPDSFRLAIHGQAFLGSAEPFVWAAVYAAVDALRLAGHDVVVDGTHMTKKRRDPWEQRGACFHIMGTTKEVCIDRALLNARDDLIPIIERMAKECDMPKAIGLYE